MLTFLHVSLCVFKCRNIHCHFHGSSGANAFLLTYEQGPDSKGLDSRDLVFKAFRIDTPFLRRAKQILVLNRQTLKLDRQILSRTTFFQGAGRNATEIKPKICLFCLCLPWTRMLRSLWCLGGDVYLDAGFYLRHLYLHIEDVGLINEIARTYPELRLDLALIESNT